MPRNTASGIYISIFAFFVGFGFVWEITWMVVVSILGIIVSSVTRTFNEDVEYTLPATEVEKIENARAQKLKPAKEVKDEDMGLREFVVVVFNWALDVIRNKKWRTW